MLDDVDRSLRSLLTDAVGEDVTVDFTAPSEEWAARRKGVVINLHLHDLREDLDGRRGDWDDVRDDDGRVVGRQPPPRRYQCTYLLSVWGDDTEQEHRVIGRILQTVPAEESIPLEHLQGALTQQEAPVVIQVGVPDVGPDTKISDIWSSVGSAARTSVQVVVFAPVIPALDTELAAPAEQMHMGVRKEDGEDGVPAGANRAASPAEAGADGSPEDKISGRVVKRWAGFKISEKGPEEEDSDGE